MISSKRSSNTAQTPALRCTWALATVFGLLLVCAGSLHAQERPGGGEQGWVRDFDSVTIEEIRPDDLPKAVEPGASTGIRTDSSDLPKPASQEELEKVVEHLKARVVRVAAVQTPPRPYRQVPMVHFGHALWVSAGDEKAARLITPLSWLKEADEVFVIPAKVAAKSKEQDAWRDIHRRSLDSVTVGKDGREWLDEHKDELVAVEPDRPDKHRNLVTLSGEDTKLAAPSKPLALFDVEKKSLFRVYGFTPFFGKSLIATKLLPSHPDEMELAFYWQTSFPAVLGAPLVSEKGELVAINTFRHPEKEDIFLAIPTGAIASYLSAGDDEDE